MTKWFQWAILTSITGSPLLSALVLLVFWWTVDRFTLGVLPDPVRWVHRALRGSTLQREILNNPHDRRARRELAEILNGQRRYAKAVETLRPNLEAGDEDAATLFVMGVACLGAGHFEQGEVFLRHVEEVSPGYRMGEVELVRGKFLLAKGEFAKAQEALRRFVATRKGTIEGRVLLARAIRGAGDDAAAALMRDEAWKEYVTAPRFQRRVERWWAWRARPSRPLTYLALVLLAGVLFSRFVAPSLASAARTASSSPYAHPYGGAAPDEEPPDEGN